jgi:uncharacterized RDD family membrane protein YckC
MSIHSAFDQTRVQHANLLRRLAAWVYDAFILAAILFFVSGVWIAINQGEAISETQRPFYQSSLLIAAFAYCAYAWTHSGQTIGMMAWRLRVQTLEGGRLSYSTSLKRFLLGALSMLLFGLGYIAMLWGDERLTLHDRITHTRVVLLPKKNKKAADVSAA